MSVKSKMLMLLASPLGRLMPDPLYLRLKYRLLMGTPLDLRNPRTYNEKLQWLKLHDRRPEYSVMVDKLAVKKYVADRVGEEFVVPLLGSWDDPAQINFSSLPDSFVLKCTHDSGGVFVVRDKSKADCKAMVQSFGKSLKHRYFYDTREWAYKAVTPRVIAEQCLEGEINDYKFFCFDGKPEYMFIATGREDKTRETCFDFYDMEFNHVDVTNGHPNAPVAPAKPENWEKMKELAAILSRGIPHVRVDFYEVGGKVYFGEFTFFHWGGMVPFEPDALDRAMGELISIK